MGVRIAAILTGNTHELATKTATIKTLIAIIDTAAHLASIGMDLSLCHGTEPCDRNGDENKANCESGLSFSKKPKAQSTKR